MLHAEFAVKASDNRAFPIFAPILRLSQAPSSRIAVARSKSEGVVAPPARSIRKAKPTPHRHLQRGISEGLPSEQILSDKLSQNHTPLGRLVDCGSIDYGRLCPALSGDTQAILDASDLSESQHSRLSQLLDVKGRDAAGELDHSVRYIALDTTQR